MDTQTTQPQTQLDPQVVNLAKAIRQVESGGNFQAKGQSGEYGAYQFMPGTWNTASQKYLGQIVPQDQATPEQQNEVAYKRLADWKNQGFNVGQIASLWNTGSHPDAYIDPEAKGTNSAGVAYDVPAYAEKVASAYQNFKKETNPTQPVPVTPQETPPSDFKPPQNLGDLLLGIGKNLGPAFVDALKKTSGDVAMAGSILKQAFPFVVGGGTLVATKNPLEAYGAYETTKQGIGSVSGLLNGGDQSSSTPPSVPGNTRPDSQPPMPSLMEPDVTQASKASKVLAEALHESLATTQGNRIFAQDPNVKEGISTVGIFGAAPDIDENGVMNTQRAQQKLSDAESSLAKQVQPILAAEGSTGSIAQAGLQAKQAFRNDPRSSTIEYEDADKAIDQAVHTYQEHNGGDRVSTDVLHKMKMELGHFYDRTASPAKNRAMRHLAEGSKKEVLRNTKNPELYKRVLKMEQNLIKGKMVLKRLDQKKAIKNGSFLKNLYHAAGHYAAIYIGDKIGGPIGAILGDMVGVHITHAIDKKFGKTIFETKEMKTALQILHKEEPKAYAVLEKELKKYGINLFKETFEQDIQKGARGLLTAGSGAIPLGPAFTQEAPAKKVKYENTKSPTKVRATNETPHDEPVTPTMPLNLKTRRQDLLDLKDRIQQRKKKRVVKLKSRGFGRYNKAGR